MEISSGQMCEDLLTLIGRVKSAMATVADRYNLTTVQVVALYAILQGDTTMGKVALRLHCDASNVTGIIDRLVAQELVVRRESQQDRRAKTLELTAKGHKVIEAVKNGLPELIGCQNLSAKEREIMHLVIGKLA